MYKDFLERITKEATKAFDEIVAEHNFEYGAEFEIAICKFLRLFLPKKYSICRGYIVDKDNNKAGDDIIIYDSNIFPKLRLIDDEYTNKQYIPFEAVYAYIEAKHELDQETLNKAFIQVENSKKLNRETRLLTETDFCNFQPDLFIPAKDWPLNKNPMFGCIISKKTKFKNNLESLRSAIRTAGEQKSFFPDLILAGDNLISIPAMDSPLRIASPFFLPDQSHLAVYNSSRAIGVGMCSLLLALNFIALKQINFKYLIAEGLGLTMMEK